MSSIVFKAAVFVKHATDFSRAWHVEQLTSNSDLPLADAALFELGQARASARKLTKKRGGKVVLMWMTVDIHDQEDSE